MSEKLLSGVRVLELSTFVAASTCGRQLAELGAEVVKVESGSGDAFRYYGLSNNMPANDEENALWDLTNGGKRSVSVNLKTAAGLEVMHRLLEKADVFLTNNREKALKKFGLDYASLKSQYPRLIYATITGFGNLGPEKDRPGFDGAAFWARSGFLADMAPGADSYPVTAASGFGDICAGNVLLSGITAALYGREKSGHGDYVTASLYGTAIWNVSVAAVPAQKCYGMKYPRERLNISPAPFRTKDGEWILPIIAVGYDKYFPLLCKAVEREDLIGDPRFKTLSDYAKPDNQAEFIHIMDEAFAKRTAEEWKQRLEALDVVYEVIVHFKSLFTSQQALENHYIQDHTMPGGKTCRIVAPPLSSYQNGPNGVATGPRLGQHTFDVLQDLGYTEEQIRDLEGQDAVRCSDEVDRLN